MAKKKKNTKLIVAAILVTIVVAAVVAGVYFVMSRGGAVATASALKFNVKISYNETTLGDYVYRAKNVGTSNMTIRIETNSSDGKKIVYIVNGAQRKAWVYSSDEWRDYSDAFTTQWATRSSEMKEYTGKLAGWTSGDLTYTNTKGETVRIFNIAVNPSLDDSLFEPS